VESCLHSSECPHVMRRYSFTLLGVRTKLLVPCGQALNLGHLSRRHFPSSRNFTPGKLHVPRCKMKQSASLLFLGWLIPHITTQSSVSHTFFFLLQTPFWLRKITTDPHILAHVNTVSG